MLASARDRDHVLIDLLTKSSGFPWYAAANMLVEDKAPALATHLLETVRLHVAITIADRDEMVGSAGGMGMGVGCGRAVRDLHSSVWLRSLLALMNGRIGRTAATRGSALRSPSLL